MAQVTCRQCGGTGDDVGIVVGWCTRCHGTGTDPGWFKLLLRRVRYAWWNVRPR